MHTYIHLRDCINTARNQKVRRPTQVIDGQKRKGWSSSSSPGFMLNGIKVGLVLNK